MSFSNLTEAQLLDYLVLGTAPPWAGDATVPDSGAVQFRSPVDSRVRIGGTVSGGVRTVTTRDGD